MSVTLMTRCSGWVRSIAPSAACLERGTSGAYSVSLSRFQATWLSSHQLRQSTMASRSRGQRGVVISRLFVIRSCRLSLKSFGTSQASRHPPFGMQCAISTVAPFVWERQKDEPSERPEPHSTPRSRMYERQAQATVQRASSRARPRFRHAYTYRRTIPAPTVDYGDL